VIDTRHKTEPRQSYVIEARSNLSLSLDRLAAVFLGLSAATLLVALGPTLFGYWPVMAVALVHLALVGWCMRVAWRGNWARETLVIDRDRLQIEHLELGRKSRTEWPTAWVRVEVQNGRMGERRVFVACHDRRQVIGSFLPVDERLALADALKESLRPFSALA
jgi:uncharacterized membrane protein